MIEIGFFVRIWMGKRMVEENCVMVFLVEMMMIIFCFKRSDYYFDDWGILVEVFLVELLFFGILNRE